jgi:hypothetical protein
MSGPLFEATIRRQAEDFRLTGERITGGIPGSASAVDLQESRLHLPLGGIRLALCKHVTPDIATSMYYTGIDPITEQQVYVARGLHDRKMQRALMQFFKPENNFEVRKALIEAGRQDLIGGCEGLIQAQAPEEALRTRQQKANEAVRGDYVRAVPNQVHSKGYRPGRRTAGRKPRQAE